MTPWLISWPVTSSATRGRALPAPSRAHARFRLSQLTGVELSPEQYEDLLVEVDADARLRAEILSHRANAAVADGTAPVSQGLRWTVEAIELSAGLDDRASRARAVSEAGFMDALLGVDPGPRLATLDASALPDLALYDQDGRVRAVRAMWRGEVARARQLFEDLRRLAREREEDLSASIFTLHLFETAIRVGDWTVAARIEHDLVDIGAPILPPIILARIRAAVAAGTGDRAAAVGSLRQFDELEAGPATSPLFWHHLETRRTAGQAALFDGDADTAADPLSRVVATAAAGDYRDPGVFPAGPDLVEALVKAGRLDDARDALHRLEQTAAEQDHPWARAGAVQARGILLSAAPAAGAGAKPSSATIAGTDAAAEAALTEALDRHRDLGLPFDEARTVAALGTLRPPSAPVPRGTDAAAGRGRPVRAPRRARSGRFDPHRGRSRRWPVASVAGRRSGPRRPAASPRPSSRWSTWSWPAARTGRPPNGCSSASAPSRRT